MIAKVNFGEMPGASEPVRKTAARTDIANAERLIELHGSELRYVGKWGKWLVWDGKRWQVDETVAVQDRAVQTARAMFATAQIAIKEADERKDENALKEAMRALGWASTSHKAARIAAMVTLARSDRSIVVNHERLDADPWAFNVQNGTIDLRTGQLRPHKQADLITKLAPVSYDPKVGAARFDQFMTEIMQGDADLIAFMLRFLGYCLTGSVRERAFSFWYGKGKNGKSVLANLMLRIMGDYASKAAPDLLFRTEKSERHPTELAALHGKRFVLSNETRKGAVWDDARVKDVTGDDRIEARRMNEDFWGFDPTHKLVVFGNNKPTIRAVDDAMKDRLRLVPFLTRFINPDLELKEKLWAEAPGILNRLVDAAVAWHTEGLATAKAVDDATAGYFREEDTIGQFFDAECVLHPEAKVTRKDLRERYVQWSEERGDEKPLGAKAFTQAVRDKGAVERSVRVGDKSPRAGWHGLRLLDAKERASRADAEGDAAATTEARQTGLPLDDDFTTQ